MSMGDGEPIEPILAGANLQITGPLEIIGVNIDETGSEVATWTTASASIANVQGWLMLQITRPDTWAGAVYLTIKGPTKSVTSYGRNFTGWRGWAGTDNPKNPWEWEWPDKRVAPW